MLFKVRATTFSMQMHVLPYDNQETPGERMAFE